MVICGDDWGGGIALTFAALYPERTELLISIDPVCYDVWPVPELEAVGRAYLIKDDGEFRAAMADSSVKDRADAAHDDLPAVEADGARPARIPRAVTHDGLCQGWIADQPRCRLRHAEI